MSWVRKIAVVGSQRGVDLEVVKKFVERLDQSNVLITSVCEGVDRAAKESADERKIRSVTIRPNYRKYGSGAANRADKEVVEAAHDVVVFMEYGDDIGNRCERIIKYAVEQQRHVAVFSAAGTLLRSIEPEFHQPEYRVIPRGT